MRPGELRGRVLIAVAGALAIAGLLANCEYEMAGCREACGSRGVTSFRYEQVGSGCWQTTHPVCLCAGSAPGGGAR